MEKEDLEILYKLKNGQTIKLKENLHYVATLHQAKQYFDAGGLCLLPIELHGKLILENDIIHYEVKEYTIEN